jgi:hypothetical protein
VKNVLPAQVAAVAVATAVVAAAVAVVAIAVVVVAAAAVVANTAAKHFSAFFGTQSVKAQDPKGSCASMFCAAI